MNNSILSFSHVINNHSQSLALLNKHASDINNKLKNIEQQLKDIEIIQSKLQNFVVSSEGSKNQTLSVSSPSISEDRIKIIVKEYVDIMLENIETKSILPLENTISENTVLEYNDDSVFAQLEQAYTNTPLFSGDDDMKIVEKKVSKPVGRKPKPKTK